MSHHFVSLIVLGILSVTVASQANAAEPNPLSCAHAHNDYYHQRPLFDALDQGFTSVEADVFLVGDELLVGHFRWELRRDRSLESLYLAPLKKRIEANDGQVYSQPARMILLVDIKEDGAEAYAVLDKLLTKYADIVSVTKDGEFHQKALTVIISGDRAQKEIAKSNPRYAGIDGRVSDLDREAPSDLLPLISDNWNNHFKWKGSGEMPAAEREKLKSIVDRSHAKGRLVRFWATPESPRVWAELHQAGVDLIGTDQLEKLAEYLNAAPEKDEGT